MVTRNMPQPGKSPAPEVDARSQELILEFENHFREVVDFHPETADRRDHVFQAWTIQKLAGLQLAVEEIARKMNAHVAGPGA